MGLAEILFMSVGLGMDAFAVAICKGLSMIKMKWKNAVVIGLYFGIFQALMPWIGFMLGKNFSSAISKIDNYIAFFLIASIGFNMLIEALKNKDEEEINDDIHPRTMIVLAIATSLDALAVGVTLAFLKVNIVKPIIFIGLITFFLSLIGVKIGNIFGEKYKKHSQIAGGVILILIAIKILIQK